MMRLVNEKLFIAFVRLQAERGGFRIIRTHSPPLPRWATLWRPSGTPSSSKRSRVELTAGPQDVSVSANCVDQLFIVAIIDLAAQSGDIDLDHVAEFFPVVIVEMFEELRF